MADNRPPIYPESARRRQQQGRVIVRVAVSAEGAPVNASVAQSSGYSALDDAAVAAVRQWRFVPASQGGKPVTATAEVPVAFRLQE
jgi:protein TonB